MKLSVFRAVLLAAVVSALVFSGCFYASAKSGGGKKKDKSAAEKVRDDIKKNLKKGKTVFVYFYADRIKGSLKELKTVQKVAKKNNGMVIKVEAEKEDQLQADYGIEYVPTVFVVRPKMGITDALVVDITEARLKKTLGKKYKMPTGVQGVNKAVKGKKTSLVFFMADWCGYCQRVIPEVDRFKRDHGKQVDIVTIDLDRDGQTAESYLVSGVPVLVALDEQGAVYRRMGYQPNSYSAFVSAFQDLGAIKK